jgi:hypothetical protein
MRDFIIPYSEKNVKRHLPEIIWLPIDYVVTARKSVPDCSAGTEAIVYIHGGGYVEAVYLRYTHRRQCGDDDGHKYPAVDDWVDAKGVLKYYTEDGTPSFCQPENQHSADGLTKSFVQHIIILLKETHDENSSLLRRFKYMGLEPHDGKPL